jgi:hypothetical protein
MMMSLSKYMARAMATAWRSPPESEPIGVVGGMVLEGRPPAQLAAEEQVARDRQLRDEGGVLVDGLDPVRDRVEARAHPHRPSLDEDLAAGVGHRPREHLDEGGLARPVVAQEADDLAPPDGEVDPPQRMDAAVELLDGPHLDEDVVLRSGHRHVPALCRRSRPEWSAIIPRMIAPMKML